MWCRLCSDAARRLQLEPIPPPVMTTSGGARLIISMDGSQGAGQLSPLFPLFSGLFGSSPTFSESSPERVEKGSKMTKKTPP